MRAKILKYLATPNRADASKIAKAIGMRNYPGKVIDELNALRTEQLIACDWSEGRFVYRLPETKPLEEVEQTIIQKIKALMCKYKDPMLPKDIQIAMGKDAPSLHTIMSRCKAAALNGAIQQVFVRNPNPRTRRNNPMICAYYLAQKRSKQIASG